jgi:prolyl oligopeptidase
MTDPYLWLEDLEAPRARAWAAEQTAATLDALGGPAFDADRATAHALMTSADQLPFIFCRGAFAYNFWTDADHPRGIWRRTSMASYRTAAPEWELTLDIDALNAAEGQSWVWQGCATLPPDHRFGLVRLSVAGSDAAEIREFDLVEKRFVEGGFVLPPAKSQAVWQDIDTLLVATNLNEEERTSSGYARAVRRWRRGTPFSASEIVFEGQTDDMAVGVDVSHDPAHPATLFLRRMGFFDMEAHVERPGDARRKLDLPTDVSMDLHRGVLLAKPRKAWEVGGVVHPSGALLAIPLNDFLAGDRKFQTLFTPTARRILEGWITTSRTIVLSILDNVCSRVEIASPTAEGGWNVSPYAGLPDTATLSLSPLQDEGPPESDAFLAIAADFITPATLYLCAPGSAPEILKQQPAQFDASGLEITQHEAPSVDGALIPYFLVAPKNLTLDGSHPTRLSGYGGFNISMLPRYAPVLGKLWLERGGLYVVANIRGGGEFGDSWHEAGRLAGKRLAHDDFAAVARDLINRGVTSARRLSAEGGSNGGLLVGSMLTRHPELFGAILCQVPLLDMLRYTKLPPGASWIAEYGDPDKPEDWAFIQSFSAYQQIEPGKPYPPILLTTSTRDDRVHPGHARKFAARLKELGYPVMLYENAEGGHGGAADKDQAALLAALGNGFLKATIGRA